MAFCAPCKLFFSVTSLPKIATWAKDAHIDDGFLHVEKICSEDLPITLDSLFLFEDLMQLGKHREARDFIRTIENELVRMVFECLFYEHLPKDIPAEEEKLFFSESIDFLADAAPSEYVLPVSIQLPSDSYELRNPIQFVGENKTLAVFSPDLGSRLRSRNGNLIKDIVFNNVVLWDKLRDIRDLYKEGPAEFHRRRAARSLW